MAAHRGGLAVVAVLNGIVGVAMSGTAKPKPQEEWVAPETAKKVKNPLPATPDSIAAGEKIYVKECLTCHGKTGRGDGPMAKVLVRVSQFFADRFP